MTTRMNTVVVGGGQAGLSVSHYLTKQAVDHVVLEQADQPGDAWRNHRWDSFTLNTPRWQSRLPGDRFGGDDADGFMPKDEIVARFEELARRAGAKPRRTADDRYSRNQIAARLTGADWRAAPSSARIRQRVGLSNLPQDWRPRDLGKRGSMPVGELLAHFGGRPSTDYRVGAVCLLRKQRP